MNSYFLYSGSFAFFSLPPTRRLLFSSRNGCKRNSLILEYRFFPDYRNFSCSSKTCLYINITIVFVPLSRSRIVKKPFIRSDEHALFFMNVRHQVIIRLNLLQDKTLNRSSNSGIPWDAEQTKCLHCSCRTSS